MKITKSLVVLFGLVLGNFMVANSQVQQINLNDNWQFRQEGNSQWLPAAVPGCVHTDLLTNKKIEDPFYRSNEKSLQWIGEKDWEYETLFNVDDTMLGSQNLDLVFKGLDTYADVYLNDTLVLKANNMHREWRINGKKLLHKGQNKLLIHFNSVFEVDVPKYLKMPYKLQAWPNNDQGDMWLSLYARKAGYEYGWDWGARLITSGIWRPIYMEAWSNSKINTIQIVTQKISKQKANLTAVFEVESSGQKGVLLTVKNGNKILAIRKVDLAMGKNKVALEFVVANPKLWWSNGLGEPNLYTFNCALNATSGTIDTKEVVTGIRSLKIIRENDKDGKSFYVLLNGVPVFIKGSNYIPIDNFLNRVTNDKYETVINSARDANMNMLRVWGGGIYENDIFYDLCDKKGILVWQDMMFACGMFPSDTDFIENVKQEVIQNVTRLRNHPSIALWCGNNENEISWYGWGWKGKYSAEVQKEYETSMHKLFDVEIPNVIATVDTTRFYHPSSPSTGYNNIPNKMGDSHYYGVWSSGDPFDAYNKNVARFMSEYGFQSFPEYKSVAEFTVPDDHKINSPVMLSHQRAKDNDTREDFGNKNINQYLDKYFNQPKDFKSFLYVSQVLQAKGIVTAIEAHRRNMPFCMGTMYWQLNDCWPVASWSGTDYYGRWKALHYAVRNAYRKEMISIINEGGKLRVYIATDRLKAVKSKLELKLMDFDGNVLSLIQKDILLAPNTSKIYFETDSSAFLKDKDLSKLVFSTKLQNDTETLATKDFYFLPEKQLTFPAVEISKMLVKNGEQYSIQLKSAKLAKAVFLSLPAKEGHFSDNYFDLLPGETKAISLNVVKGISISEKDLEIITLVDSYKK